jgi:SAM-dependent methyltransferase
MRRVAVFALACCLNAATAQEIERPPFITTPADVVERMLRLAGAGASDLVLDLGSGDGRIVIEAARKFGSRGLGVELDAGLVEKSRENARRASVADRVRFVHGDVLRTDISQASIVTVYLLPSLMGRLQARFLDELQPGARVVSHAFYMPGWKPDRIERIRVAEPHARQGDESTLYLWVVPAKARGLWIETQQKHWQLRILQNFQEIEVEARSDGRTIPVSAARLNGKDLSWEAPGVRFAGRIDGMRLAGELFQGGTVSALSFAKTP